MEPMWTSRRDLGVTRQSMKMEEHASCASVDRVLQQN
jgi:hypothetical protein